MKYIVNKDGKVVGTIRFGQPDIKNLQKQGQFVVESSENIPLREAEYKDGKIIRHVKTKEEIDREIAERKRHEREALIRKRMREIAEKQLIEEGILEPETERRE